MPHALCFERCELGASGGDKCGERESVACAPIEDGESSAGFCRPLCTNDSQCPDGVCDPVHGVCVDEGVPDQSFGLRCSAELTGNPDEDAGAPDGVGACMGLCVELNDAPKVCSRACVFGETRECAPASSGLRRGACVFVTEGGGIGDVGYCGELCDCTLDCIEPTFVCDAFDDDNLERVLGRKGVCTDTALVTTRELTCKD